MMTVTDTTTTTDVDELGAALDELAHRLADVPGQHPRDIQIAHVLLQLTDVCTQTGRVSDLLLSTLRAYGCDAGETQTLDRAMAGLSLRLGAWLGRDRE